MFLQLFYNFFTTFYSDGIIRTILIFNQMETAFKQHMVLQQTRYGGGGGEASKA